MIQVIQAIQKAKAAQSKFSEIDSAHRAQLLERLTVQIELHQNEIISWESQAVTGERGFYLEHSIRSSRLRIAEAIEQLQLADEKCSPTGLVSIILPSVFGFRALIERLAPALAAGNTVLVKISSKGMDWSQPFAKMLKEAGFEEGVVQLLYGSGAEIGALMAAHPAVRAVSFAGRYSTADSILRQPSLFQKKLQFSKSGNNSAILIGESWSDQQLEILVQSCFLGDGRLPWSTHKIFVLESAVQGFYEKFGQLSEMYQPVSQQFEGKSIYFGQLEAIIKEGGKALANHKGVIRDLSHCSVYQQDELAGPIVLVSAVKYLHESVKWANTGYLGMSNLILGDEDKALRLAQKLECGQVWINSWITPENGVVSGVKQSATGIMDFRVFGGFYSDRKKIVSTLSK